jgi:hypothetical protein
MKFATPGPTPTTSPEISVPANKCKMKTGSGRGSIFEYNWVADHRTFVTTSREVCTNLLLVKGNATLSKLSTDNELI